MKHRILVSLIMTVLLLSGCTTPGVKYSQNLFEHIPHDTPIVVTANPNDITALAEMAMKEINFSEFFEGKIDIDAATIDSYRVMAVQMLETLGIPVDKIESVGVFMYFNKPVVLLSGDFTQKGVSDKMVEIGFQKRDDGLFDYVYDKQKLAIPADGLMMMAETEVLLDVVNLPKGKSLWDREDFTEYRKTSPLDNSVFVWGKPPQDFLKDFPYHEAVGDVSLALKFGRTITMQGVIRIKDPEKTVYLHDVLVGAISMGKGLFGGDPDYGPVFKGFQVGQNNKQVTVSLVVPADHVKAVKERIKNDFMNNNTSSLDKLNKFFNAF